jgi:hypothetical protein
MNHFSNRLVMLLLFTIYMKFRSHAQEHTPHAAWLLPGVDVNASDHLRLRKHHPEPWVYLFASENGRTRMVAGTLPYECRYAAGKEEKFYDRRQEYGLEPYHCWRQSTALLQEPVAADAIF